MRLLHAVAVVVLAVAVSGCISEELPCRRILPGVELLGYQPGIHRAALQARESPSAFADLDWYPASPTVENPPERPGLPLRNESVAAAYRDAVWRLIAVGMLENESAEKIWFLLIETDTPFHYWIGMDSRTLPLGGPYPAMINPPAFNETQAGMFLRGVANMDASRENRIIASLRTEGRWEGPLELRLDDLYREVAHPAPASERWRFEFQSPTVEAGGYLDANFMVSMTIYSNDLLTFVILPARDAPRTTEEADLVMERVFAGLNLPPPALRYDDPYPRGELYFKFSELCTD